MAHEKLIAEQKNFLIPVLMEDLDSVELEKHPELQTYIRTHTYIDARKLQDKRLKNQEKEIEYIRKRIR